MENSYSYRYVLTAVRAWEYVIEGQDISGYIAAFLLNRGHSYAQAFCIDCVSEILRRWDSIKHESGGSEHVPVSLIVSTITELMKKDLER